MKFNHNEQQPNQDRNVHPQDAAVKQQLTGRTPQLRQNTGRQAVVPPVAPQSFEQTPAMNRAEHTDAAAAAAKARAAAAAAGAAQSANGAGYASAQQAPTAGPSAATGRTPQLGQATGRIRTAAPAAAAYAANQAHAPFNGRAPQSGQVPPQPPTGPHGAASPQEPNGGKKRWLIPVIIAVVLLLLVLGYFLIVRPSSQQVAATSTSPSDASVSTMAAEAKNSKADSKAGNKAPDYSYVKPENFKVIDSEFKTFPDGAPTFIPTSENNTNVGPIIQKMGTLGYPKCNFVGPLSAVCTEQSLLNAFGLVETMVPIQKIGQSTILGHRTTIKNHDMYDLDFAKKGERFFIDDDTTKTRWVYEVVEKTYIPESELDSRVFLGREAGKAYQEGPFAGNTVMLVTCEPKNQWGSSVKRLLVYGQLYKTLSYEQLAEVKKDGTSADLGVKCVSPGVLPSDMP